MLEPTIADQPGAYIRFSSHRARDNAFYRLTRRPQGFFSFRRRTHPGGVYWLTEAEIVVITDVRRKGAFTRVRGPYDDLRRCWE